MKQILTFIIALVLIGMGSVQAQVPNPFIPTNAFLQPTDFFPITQYFFNQHIFNPCFAGDQYQPNFSMVARYRMKQNPTGIQPKPQTYHLQTSTYEPNLGLGLGAHATYHRPIANIWFAAERLTEAGVTINYETFFGDNATIRIGTMIGLVNMKPANKDANGDPINDIDFLNERKIKPNFDLGVLFLKNNFYFGASVSHLTDLSFQFFPGYIYRFQRKAYVTTGLHASFADIINFNPSIFFSQYLSNGRNFSFVLDANLLMDYKEKYFLGITGRVNDPAYSGAILVGARFAQQYQINLSCDIPKNNRPRQIEISINSFLIYEDEEEEEIQEDL